MTDSGVEARALVPQGRQAVVAQAQGFTHLHAAHCESGVTCKLLEEAGLVASEPMIFGVGSGLFFAHLSFIKVMGQPLTTFRALPGAIFRKACRRLGVVYRRETFARPGAAMRRLDTLLDQGLRVGLQVNIFWLPYVPRHMRVHFNGHNLLVLEKRDDVYIVSDPVLETPFECPADDLARARFSGGNRFLGRGLLYYPTAAPDAPDLGGAIQAGITETCHRMLHIPRVFRWLGLHGIRHLARLVPRWPERAGERQARQWMAGLVRMQEEIGTGGAGFRYLFAAFLQEAATHPGWADLGALSEQTTRLGDQWRRFALHASRMARGKPDKAWDELGSMLQELAVTEQRLFEELDRVRRRRPLLSG